MNLFNMIIVIGIALILSVLSTSQAAPGSKFPQFLPDDAPFVNETRSAEICKNDWDCGYVGLRDDHTIRSVECWCTCPSGQRCGLVGLYKELDTNSQFYRCAK